MTDNVVPNYQRVHQADDQDLMAPIPNFTEPGENANLVANRTILTLNRAGSDPRNPILKGLGVRVTFGIGLTDLLLGVWLYQKFGEFGLNLAEQAAPAGPGLMTFDFVAGSGQTVSGTRGTGAKRNFLRWETGFGSVERQFYIKEHDPDVVTLNGIPALDPETLEPVEVVCQIIDASRDWLDVTVDFFPSWNDEFQKVHVGENAALNPGFLKAYGGAIVVSVFDTAEEENVGTQVNPFTDQAIGDQHKIQVQNTEGVKELTFRFRSKAGSSYFLDIPVKLRLVAPDDCICATPGAEECTALLFNAGTESVEGSPIESSTPGEQVVLGPAGTELEEALLVITAHGTTIGEDRELRVTKKRLVEDAQALGGCRFEQFGDPEDYIPAVQDGDSPVMSPPFGDPKRLTIALSVTDLIADQIALIEVQVKDGEMLSIPIAVPGPRLRDIVGFAPGGLGGGTPCEY